MKLYELTIQKAHGLLKKREISSRELTLSVLDRIASVEDKVDAYLTIAAETALEQADAADRAIAKGEMTALTGIPMGCQRPDLHPEPAHHMCVKNT